MLFTCACDEGWGGLGCEKPQCPRGIDPLPPLHGKAEVQLLRCDLAPDDRRTFALGWGQHVTRALSPSMTPLQLQAALVALPGL